MIRMFKILIMLCWVQTTLFGQSISSIHARWDDSFREWILYDADADEEGTLELRWKLNNDWSKWDYSLGDEGGSIDMKWRDNPEEWEIRGHDDMIYARTVWPRDLSSWRLKNDEITIIFESRYSTRADEWRLKTRHYGEFIIHTEYNGDPRDWVVVDSLSDEISFSMKMAMVFLAIHHGTPRN